MAIYHQFLMQLRAESGRRFLWRLRLRLKMEKYSFLLLCEKFYQSEDRFGYLVLFCSRLDLSEGYENFRHFRILSDKIPGGSGDFFISENGLLKDFRYLILLCFCLITPLHRTKKSNFEIKQRNDWLNSNFYTRLRRNKENLSNYRLAENLRWHLLNCTTSEQKTLSQAVLFAFPHKFLTKTMISPKWSLLLSSNL